MQNLLIPMTALFVASCTTPLVKHNDLAEFEIKGKVKTLTEFTCGIEDPSMVVKTVRNFNPEGNLLSEDVYRNGSHFTRTLYTYDLKGRKSQERFFQYGDKVAGHTSEYRYDDETGAVVKSTVLENGGSLRTSLAFNEQGRLTEEKHFGRDGIMEFAIQYSYDQNAHLAEKKFIRLRELALDKRDEGYNASCKWGSGSEKAMNEVSANYYSYAFTYDEKGNTETEKLLNADGTAGYEMKYQYGDPEIAEASILDRPTKSYDALPDTWKPGELQPHCYRSMFKRFHKKPAYDKEGNWTSRYVMDGKGQLARVVNRVIVYY